MFLQERYLHGKMCKLEHMNCMQLQVIDSRHPNPQCQSPPQCMDPLSLMFLPSTILSFRVLSWYVFSQNIQNYSECYEF